MANHVWSDKHQCSSVLFGEQLLSGEVEKAKFAITDLFGERWLLQEFE